MFIVFFFVILVFVALTDLLPVGCLSMASVVGTIQAQWQDVTSHYYYCSRLLIHACKCDIFYFILGVAVYTGKETKVRDNNPL